MSPSFARRLAAVFGLLAVALGAFGAHGLKGISAEAYERSWRTAVLYHLVHSVVLLALSARPRVPAVPAWSFVVGMLLFSGGLYFFPLWPMRWLMFPVTPLGGLALMFGWAWLIFARERTP